MIFLGEVEGKFPCPDYATVRQCYGKLAVKMQFYRIARGRGRSIIRIDPSVVECTRCKRRFKIYKDTNSDSADFVWFSPLPSKKVKISRK